MHLKISAMNEFSNPKVELRALFSGPHWLAPYQEAWLVWNFNTVRNSFLDYNNFY
jgi:hypothetical protein